MTNRLNEAAAHYLARAANAYLEADLQWRYTASGLRPVIVGRIDARPICARLNLVARLAREESIPASRRVELAIEILEAPIAH